MYLYVKEAQLHFLQLVQDKPIAGDHVYVLAPVAVSDAAVPLQTALSAPAFTAGSGFTVTIAVSVLAQPLVSVPFTT